jgi:nucleoside-diphosphate-sugar epimerase
VTASILLTGATGYLGSHLTRALTNGGQRVAILKRAGSSLDRLAGCIDKIACHDIDQDGIDQAFSRQHVDAVVHCAASYGRNGESSLDVFDANTRFPLQILQAATERGCRLFVNIDTTLPDSLNTYTLSKSQFRQWGQFMARKTGIRFANAKLEHFYGPGEPGHSFTARVIAACGRNEPELLLTRGEQKRDFVYIDDVVDALLKILEHGLGADFHLSEFEIGSGSPITIRELVETVHRLTRSTTRLVFGAVPYREGEVMESHADLSAIRQLGWNAQVALNDGLGKSLPGADD